MVYNDLIRKKKNNNVLLLIQIKNNKEKNCLHDVLTSPLKFHYSCYRSNKFVLTMGHMVNKLLVPLKK